MKRTEITRILVGVAVALTLSGVVEAASAGPAVIVTQTNSTSLTVPGSGTGAGTGAPASLYPSSVTVSGASGVVLDANVTLNGLSHTCTRDVDVLLVGPGGQNLVVMSDVAGCSATSNATVTIDDEAAGPFPLTTTPLTTSSYQPLDNDAPGADAFPAPAPAPSAATTLTTFDGTNPNGTWSLYVVDDAAGDTGTISGGWTLTLDVGSAALPGALQFSSPTYSGAEGGGTATIAVSRTGGDDGAVSVQFSTVAGGTATAGSDYTSTTQTVNFADGVTSASASVPILDDPDSEGINETVNLQLSAPTGGATLGSQSTATLAIEDNDSTANATPLTLPGTGSGNPSGAPASTYPSNIRRQGLSGTVLDVNVTINNFSHTLTGDVDLLLVSPSGHRATIMSDLGTAATSGATFTIDDEAATTLPPGGIANGGTYKPLDVDTAGADAFPAPAPAESGSSALSTFDGTSPNGTWSLYVVDDASGDTGTISGGWTLTLTSGATPLPGILQFSSASYSGAEGAGTATITITRTGGADGAVGVTFQTSPGTATAGSDYTHVSQSVPFADAQTSATVNVPVLDDPAAEGVNETVNLALSAPTGGASLGSQTTATLAIEDNDAGYNTTPLTIPGTGTGLTSGAPASTYPSNIRIQGLVGNVTDVNVTLTNLSHAFPRDLDVLLVGPGGQNLLLMSDVGGSTAQNGRTFTFDDEAAGTIPEAGPIGNNTSYKPSNVTDPANPTDSFPAPAPVPSASTALSIFDGASPNGTWSLYVVDDASGEVGSLAGGWSLTIAGPTAVRIVSFSARQPAAGSPVVLRWRTASEAGVVGFRVFGVVRGGSVRLNRVLIRARYGLRGGGYMLRVPGHRAFARYRLELVKTDGSRVRGPTVRLRRAR